MFLLKACPKCGGDVFVEHDEYGNADLKCLQCGRYLPPTTIPRRRKS
jgi:ribosomal protein S27AE